MIVVHPGDEIHIHALEGGACSGRLLLLICRPELALSILIGRAMKAVESASTFSREKYHAVPVAPKGWCRIAFIYFGYLRMNVASDETIRVTKGVWQLSKSECCSHVS